MTYVFSSSNLAGKKVFERKQKIGNYNNVYMHTYRIYLAVDLAYFETKCSKKIHVRFSVRMKFGIVFRMVGLLVVLRGMHRCYGVLYKYYNSLCFILLIKLSAGWSVLG